MGRLSSTHTYALMDVRAATFAEIHKRLMGAGYEHAVQKEGSELVLDMHGIALRALPAPGPAGELLVGVTEKGDEVVINHPNLMTDAEGVGHIVFSPEQARSLAHLLLKHAAAAERASGK